MNRLVHIAAAAFLISSEIPATADPTYDRAQAEERARRDASEELVRIRREEAQDRDRQLYERQQREREQAEREREQQGLRR